ncbi:16S rRNA (cytidine(1402)-2'-O)-methyltransferase [Trichothermofontia sp.]
MVDAIGTLYVVGTPIGNLEDISLRAIRILQQVALVAAEDTRHTGKLLQHLQIATPQLSYYEHNSRGRIPQLLERLQQGQDIALVTDAGMPGIADPGYELVQACQTAAIPVVPIPGPSAVITALSGAGLPCDRFVFEGFLPRKGSERRERLQALQSEPRTLVLYEAPHRLLQTLQDLAVTLGKDRTIVTARELTKRYESFWRGTLTDAIAYYTDQMAPRGEFTLVIAGAGVAFPPGHLQHEATACSEADLKQALQALLQQGLSRSQASRQLAAQTHYPRRQLYQLALTLGEQEEPPVENSV